MKVIISELEGKSCDLRGIEVEIGEWQKRVSDLENGRKKLDDIEGIQVQDVTEKIAKLKEEWSIFLENREVEIRIRISEKMRMSRMTNSEI